MSLPLFVNSTNAVNIDPEYSFENRSELIRSQIRTQDGGLKQYKFGEFAAFKIPVKYFPSSDMQQVNEWWENQTDLKFTWSGSDYNVRITNRRAPIKKYIKPYDNLFEGVIEIESYQ